MQKITAAAPCFAFNIAEREKRRECKALPFVHTYIRMVHACTHHAPLCDMGQRAYIHSVSSSAVAHAKIHSLVLARKVVEGQIYQISYFFISGSRMQIPPSRASDVQES
jgi:hypothetical protein